MKEKESYKDLFESHNKSSKEEELNQTLDFFKIENIKLCDQMLKMCHDFKKKDEMWIKHLKLYITKSMHYFESSLDSKIKNHLELKFSFLNDKIMKLKTHVIKTIYNKIKISYTIN